MRHAICACFLFTGLFFTSAVWGQSTISDRSWELTSSKGIWAALLPAYELGINANGSPAFRDNLDDVGYIGDLKLVRRFLGTRTSFETKGYWGFAESINTTGVIDIAVPNPSSGLGSLLSGNRTHLKSKIGHYGFDVGLRDTWRTRVGGLSAGIAFSYMAFDQKFDVDYGAIQLMQEKLNTDFRGGKALFGWDGRLCGHPTNVDLAVGFYDMDADYRFIEQAITGSLDQELSKNVTTFEASVTTYKCIHKYRCGFTLGTMYISDMPTISHNLGSPTTLGTDDAVTLTGQIQVLL